MTVEIKVDGVSRLGKVLASLKDKFGKGQKEVVIVGFTQYYALYVHEIQMRHQVGQWKYLETPAREFRTQIGQTVENFLKRKATLQQALMAGGLLLQRQAQKITPVDTSALKASAFTCPEKELQAVSQAKFAASESIRQAQLAKKAKRKKK